jgi:O-antigen ligase
VLQWKLNATIAGKWSPTEYFLIAFLIILVINTFANDWRRSSPDQDPILQHLVEGYFIPVLLYGIARHSVCQTRHLMWFYGVLGVFGIYLSLTAICEMAGAWSLVIPHYIADPELGIHFGRARGPFLQSVRLGIYLNAAFAAIWIPWVWQRRLGQSGMVIGLLSSGLVALGAVFTLTRSIWLGVGAGFLILVAATFTGRFRRFALYCMLVGAVLIVPLKDSLLSFQREYGSQETLESTRMRAVFAYVSWLMFKDHPWAGVGFGHFPHRKDAYLNDRQTELNLNSIRRYIHHNTYLSLLVELGIFGLAAYLAVLGCWGQTAWRLWRDRSAPLDCRGHALFCLMLLASCLIQMLFHEVSYTVFENGILFVSAGILSGMAAGRVTHARHLQAGDRSFALQQLARQLPSPVGSFRTSTDSGP